MYSKVPYMRIGHDIDGVYLLVSLMCYIHGKKMRRGIQSIEIKNKEAESYKSKIDYGSSYRLVKGIKYA